MSTRPAIRSRSAPSVVSYSLTSPMPSTSFSSGTSVKPETVATLRPFMSSKVDQLVSCFCASSVPK